VPWELLYPQDAGRPDAGFLVEQFPVTRSAFRWRPARSLILQPARLVLPGRSLPAARAEVDAVRELLDPGQPESSLISSLDQLLGLIDEGNFGLLHFACHNSYRPADGPSITLDDLAFTPTLLAVPAINKVLARAAPMIFMNACRSAGLSATYNRLDGWAAKFLEAGAGAFIGSLWAVSDDAAREFTGEFYRLLQAGSPLGLAVMQARRAAAGQSGDPTWLAYSVYGDPRASFQPLFSVR
jgi:CHAT domain-containing protein